MSKPPSELIDKGNSSTTQVNTSSETNKNLPTVVKPEIIIPMDRNTTPERPLTSPEPEIREEAHIEHDMNHHHEEEQTQPFIDGKTQFFNLFFTIIRTIVIVLTWIACLYVIAIQILVAIQARPYEDGFIALLAFYAL
jgi:hypothetical protein